VIPVLWLALALSFAGFLAVQVIDRVRRTHQ
jgi:hypothetical protein